MNYITDNQELEEFENYLKNISKELQTKYKEEGKYLYMGTVVRVGTVILYPILFVFFVSLFVSISATTFSNNEYYFNCIGYFSVYCFSKFYDWLYYTSF